MGYLWRQIAGPAVVLSNSNSANPTFTAPTVPDDTQLKFLLTVADDKSASSNPATVTITVKHINRNPIANAGSDQTVNTGYVVSLDGSKSKDPDNDPLVYSWKQVGGSSVILNAANTAIPSSTAPTVSSNSTLEFSLTVKDDKGAESTNPAIVSVTMKADVSALIDKADALTGLGNYTQALQYFDKALDIDPNDKNVLYDKGDTLYKQGDNTQAIQYFDKVLAIDPNYKYALDGKQNALSHIGGNATK